MTDDAGTSAGSSSPHPDLDRLADLDAGVDVEPDVRAHAAGCAECQRSLSALRATRDELAALPTVSMPADVADRVDAALANTAGEQTDGTVVPLSDIRERKRRGGLVAGGVAASVIAALIAAVVVSAVVSDDKTTPAASSAAALGSS